MGRACEYKRKRIGFLTVIEKLPQKDRWGAVLWKCKCDCGNETILNSGVISREGVISCSIRCPVRVESNQIKNFLKKRVVAKNDCWIWAGSRDKDGYGNYLFGRKAHRFSYETFKGEIPLGKFVLHKCDTPSCVNPEHLFLGDAKENAEDCVKKKRNSRGEKNGSAKLRDEDIREIRKAYATGEKSLANIGAKFGISRTVAHKIVKFKLWKHVE